MMFLNAMLAGFVVLGAVPIIIHLLNKQRFRVVEWAAINFLLKALKKNSRRLQMRDLLLLILRTAAVILAALALARPTIAPGHFSLLGAGGAINAVVVLDNSRSMGYREGNETRFAQAKTKAKAIIDQLPKGSGVALVLMSDLAQVEISEPSHDLNFVADAIDKAPLSDGGTSVMSGLGKAWDLLKKSEGGLEIYLITDLQANAWPPAEDTNWKTLTSELTSHHELRLYLAEVGSAARENISIDDLEPVDPLVTNDSDTTFVATVRNHGLAPADNVEVKLLIDDGEGGEMRAVSSAAIDHLASVQEVTLQCRFEKGGRHRIEAKIGPDHLEADNARYLALDVIDRLKVLIVDGSSEGGFTGGAGFIRAALAPGAAQPEEGATANLIEAEITSPGALVDTPLDGYQAVILSDVGELTPGVTDGLKAFIASGKALIIFLGANVHPDNYNQLLGERSGLLPAHLAAHPTEYPGEGDVKGTTFATSGLTHPIVSFFAAKDNLPFLARPRFLQAYGLDLPTMVNGSNGGSAVVLRFADNKPALVERTVGGGTVLLFACSADKQWSDFPLSPAFLMVVRRTVQHAVLARRTPPTVAVHDSLLLRLPSRDAGSRLQVIDPRGNQSKLTATLTSDGRNAQVEVSETPFAGFWQIGEGASASRYATNGPADESSLETLDKPALQARSGSIDWRYLTAEGDVSAQIAHSRVGREIWPLLITLAILALVSESFLAMHWAPKGT
jgi:hypothetical protein